MPKRLKGVAWAFLYELMKRSVSSCRMEGFSSRLWEVGLWSLFLGMTRNLCGAVETHPPSRWTHYTNTNRVYQIIPDGDQVWFGTEGGLKKFDRVTSQWTTGTLAEGLPIRHINALAADFRSVWVGSQQGGLARFDRAQNLWQPIPVAAGLAAQQRILCLAVEGDNLWVGTDGAGIARYDMRTQSWTTYTKSSTQDGLQSDVIYDLVVAGPAVWAATGFGLARFDRATEQWVTYRPPNSPLEGRIDHLAGQDNTIWAVTESRGVAVFDAATMQLTEYRPPPSLEDARFHAVASLADRVWLGTGHGLIGIEGPAEKWQLVPETPWYITALAATPEELWVATAHDGLRRYDFLEKTWTVFPETETLPGHRITCVASTPTATWFGLLDQGVFRFDLATQTWTRFSPEDGLPSLEVRALAAWGEEAWCATSAGVGYFNGTTGKWQTVTAETTDGGLVSNNTTDLLLYDNTLWIAGKGGLSGCTLQMTHWQKWLLEDLPTAPNFPRLLLDRALDSLWVVGPDRAWRFNRAETDPQRQWTPFRAPFHSSSPAEAGLPLIRSATLDLTSVWFLCHDGLRQYEKQTRQWWIHDERAGVPLINLTCLALGPDRVWCGTQDGLFQFDRTSRQWTEIGAGELTSYAIADLAFDEEFLWVVTKDGVYRFHPRQGTWDRPEENLVAGLQKVFVTPTHLWFAGTGGLSAYRRAGNHGE